jgi:hypothetical protein
MLHAANVARALLAVLVVLAAVGVALVCLRGPLARLHPGLAARLPVRTRRCPTSLLDCKPRTCAGGRLR